MAQGKTKEAIMSAELDEVLKKADQRRSGRCPPHQKPTFTHDR
jgi:hypothetical protein